MVTIESTQLPCHANSHMNALPKNRTSRPWGTHKGCPNVTRFLLRQRASSHQPGRLNIKNHDDHHHGGHYWPYPPNYWEIDTPPCSRNSTSTRTQHPPHRKCHITICFCPILVAVTPCGTKIFQLNPCVSSNAEATLGDIHLIPSHLNSKILAGQELEFLFASGEYFCC